jgi:hypothetical protein
LSSGSIAVARGYLYRRCWKGTRCARNSEAAKLKIEVFLAGVDGFVTFKEGNISIDAGKESRKGEN